jgi:hypothetical protein
MGWAGCYCIAVLMAGVAFKSSAFAMLCMLFLLMLPGDSVLSVEEALLGFSNVDVFATASARRSPPARSE